MELYPLKFQPLYKYRLWGGNKLKTVLKKDYNEQNIGESWEVSDVDGDETRVMNGPLKGYRLKELIDKFKGEFIGHSVYKMFNGQFPLLIKFIDSKAPLSIQVHPDNEFAKKQHNSFGKNEMWFIMENDLDAEIIMGFEKELSIVEYQAAQKTTSILEFVHYEKTHKGDAFYIPAGRIHAIGAGVLLAEIQQTSDITYRIYDYDRIDKLTGEKRELHNDLAENVLDFNVCENYKTDYPTKKNKSNKLIHSPYFKTNYLLIEGEITKDYSKLDSFVIYMCVDNDIILTVNNIRYTLKYGETILLPASTSIVKLTSSNGGILEVFM